MTDHDMKRLAPELRRWAERPTALSPRAARARVVAQLPNRRRRPTWRLVGAAGALAATAMIVALVVGRHDEPVIGPPPVAASGQRMIVHELSSGTKLYIVVRPSAAGDES